VAWLTWIAWRISKGYSTWHATANNKITLCGKSPPPLLSIWRGIAAPPVEEQCQICRTVEFREFHQRKAS